MNSKLLVFIIFVLLVTACTKNTLFEEKVFFNKVGWNKDAPAVFNVVYADTSQVVDIGMTILHSEDYSFSNLWLFVDVDGPEGLVQKDTMELFFAHTNGQWLGNRKGNEIQISALYQYGVKLSKPGNYTFAVTQGMRRSPLEGIEEFSWWIQESDAKAEK